MCTCSQAYVEVMQQTIWGTAGPQEKKKAGFLPVMTVVSRSPMVHTGLYNEKRGESKSMKFDKMFM